MWSAAAVVVMLPRKVFARDGRRLLASDMPIAVSAIDLAALSVIAS